MIGIFIGNELFFFFVVYAVFAECKTDDLCVREEITVIVLEIICECLVCSHTFWDSYEAHKPAFSNAGCPSLSLRFCWKEIFTIFWPKKYSQETYCSRLCAFSTKSSVWLFTVSVNFVCSLWTWWIRFIWCSRCFRSKMSSQYFSPITSYNPVILSPAKIIRNTSEATPNLFMYTKVLVGVKVGLTHTFLNIVMLPLKRIILEWRRSRHVMRF